MAKFVRQVLPMLNPARWLRAYRFSREQPEYRKARNDLELRLYGKMLRLDMLHYGYFDDPEVDPETLSLRDVEDAQRRYAQLIDERVLDRDAPVLDVGCGMGGLANILHSAGCSVEALTPNETQVAHITEAYPQIPCHHCRFEDFQSSSRFGTIIHSESLQYIDLKTAFDLCGQLLADDGRWIVVDYFRNKPRAKHRSGHNIGDFHLAIERHGWTIEEETNITANCLPTLRFVQLYVDRFGRPGYEFATEKFRIKRPFLYDLTSDLRDAVNRKADRELKAVDPTTFQEEKAYMLYVLQRR